VVERIVGGGFGHLLASTASCAHPHAWTESEKHCGVCSQCIDRRFAILAAGAEELEPADGYAADLLTGERASNQDRRMAVAYIKLCQTISKCDRDQLVERYPQAVSAVGEVPGLSSGEVLDRIWQLHRRHADGVLKVIAAGLVRHGQDLLRAKLPPSAILSLSVGRSHIEEPPTLDYHQQMADFMDRLGPPVCEFAVDEANERICFRGGFFLDRADYRLFSALMGNHRSAKSEDTDGAYTRLCDLADQLGYDEQQTLRQQITRTRRKLTDWLAVELGIASPDGMIENYRNDGYRLSPELREVTLADLRIADRRMSRAQLGNVTEGTRS
jgi:hypothetical protein